MSTIPTFFSFCAHTPPSLGPAGQQAFKQHEVQKDMDLVRDLAQDANTQGVLSTSATRQITLWHKTAITLVHDQPQGWKQQVVDGLDALQKNLPAAEWTTIAKYVALVKVVLQEVQ